MKVGSLIMCQLSLAVAAAMAQTQQPIGTVGIQDATVAGALEITNAKAILVGSTTVTAHNHTAEVALTRGGTVRVCSTSGLHLSEGTEAANPQPLMLALDRGAIEVQMAATTRDVVMTPDLRFTLGADGPLDLHLRVTRDGDTCVENLGVKAPILHIADPFGEGAYELRAGQHVLFEHASLKEVVDHESSSCGCPPETPEPATTIADALLSPAAVGAKTESTPPEAAAKQHPFPAAVSEGLAPAAAVPQAPVGALHSQVSATLSSSGAPDSTVTPAPPASQAEASTSAANTAAGSPAIPTAAPPRQQQHGVFHAIGRFFKRIFGAD
jgi:hypothetical protein